MTSLTIEGLKQQKRWLLWSLEPSKDGKLTKVPRQPNGHKASLLNPSNLHTYADLLPLVAKFSGIGLALGEFDGVYITGVDVDACCDAATGKFSPESREVVIGLDSYTEYSPSGTGCHIWVLGKLPGKGLQKPYPGCKQIEIKGQGYYHTFSGRHIGKTPATLEDRQEQVTALYNRVANQAKPSKAASLTTTIPLSEEERFQKLMVGEFTGDQSAADFAFCILLAKKHGCDVFRIREEVLKSGMYRDKWDREDYARTTITRAITVVLKESSALFVADDADQFVDNGLDEYLVEKKTKDHEGWFPLGDISLVGGSSGTGKTYWSMAVLEKVRLGLEVWGHKTQARDYRVLMLDRGAKAMRRTLDKMRLSPEAKQRVIRVTSSQYAAGPVAVMSEITEREPGAEAFFVEGLDMWIKESAKMDGVATALDELQRIATRRNVAIIASVGSPKQKTAKDKDTERYHGRDTIFGSVAWGRKSETIVLISKTDNDPLHDDCPRQYSILVRNGWAEHFWMDFADGELRMVDKPEPQEQEPKEREYKGGPRKHSLLEQNVFARFGPGERILYSPELGVSDRKFYTWAKSAAAHGLIEQRLGSGPLGGYYMNDPPGTVA